MTSDEQKIFRAMVVYTQTASLTSFFANEVLQEEYLKNHAIVADPQQVNFLDFAQQYCRKLPRLAQVLGNTAGLLAGYLTMKYSN